VPVYVVQKDPKGIQKKNMKKVLRKCTVQSLITEVQEKCRLSELSSSR
jgi:hypothetical protein